VKIDPTGESFVPVLIENLRDPSDEVRRFAAWALGDLGPKAAGAVNPLTEALQDPEAIVRASAAGALWKIDEKAASNAVPVLAAALRSANEEHARRCAAQQVLGTGPEAVRAVPALVENLSNDRIAPDMADALGRIGPRAEAAVDPLTEVLRDEKGRIRVWAAEALWRIRRDDASLKPLIEALGSDDPWAPQSAAIALGNIGPPAKTAAGALTELLEHPENYVRQSAADALEKIDPASADGKTEKPSDEDDVGHLGFPGGPLSDKEPPPLKPLKPLE
jgi:HEAT repeat protein